MNRWRRFPTLFLVAVAVTTSLSAQQKAKYLKPAEIVQLISDSKTKYGIHTANAGEGILADPLSTMFPMAVEPVPMPIVVAGKDGQPRLRSFEITDKAGAFLERSEPLFMQKKLTEARAVYLELIAEVPDCYSAYAHIGDTYFMSGEFDSALVWYERARPMNPNDYQLPFFRAHALYKLGRYEESRQEYIQALVLNPRHNTTYLHLHNYGKKLGITFNRTLFTPKSVAVATDTGIAVTVDENGGAAWLMYALAKAMWLGEPEHRRQMTGKEERMPWTSVEDVESIIALLIAYSGAVEKGEMERDPQLDLLEKIGRDGYLAEFVVYEFGSRVIPNIVLLQPEEFRKSMAEFIGKYVVPVSVNKSSPLSRPLDK